MKKPLPEFILHVDGGARGNPGPAAAGIVLCEPGNRTLFEAGYWLGHLTNNQAEYSALLKGLEAADRFEAGKLTIYSDSELMVRQLLGQYKVRSPELKPLYEQALVRLDSLTSWKIQHVPRERNARADELVNRALDTGRDVVLAPAAMEESDPSSQPAVAGEHPAPIHVLVTRKGSGLPCSPSCVNQTRFTIERTLPPGLTLDVAARVIAAVQSLRYRPGVPNGAAAPQTFACPSCGAVFRMALVKA